MAEFFYIYFPIYFTKDNSLFQIKGKSRQGVFCIELWINYSKFLQNLMLFNVGTESH